MPHATSGYSGSEIIEILKRWFGKEESDFDTIVAEMLPLAEFAYCKAHDWKFLNKQNLSLTVATGTNEYTLNTANIGYEMAASDVESIYSPTSGIFLKKVNLNSLRRLDPETDDGTTSEYLQAWAISGDNKIVVYPKTFADTTLKIDGKCTPSALLTLSNYPTIPFKYQESFIEYLIARVAARENDDRADSLKASALALVRADIANDMNVGGETEEPRIKSLREQGDGSSLNSFDPLNLFNR